MYASPAWAPLLSETRLMALEAIQNKSARIMTGCIKSTDNTSLLLEANLLPLGLNYQIDSTIAAEKARRQINDDYLHEAASKYCPKNERNFQTWNQLSDYTLNKIDLDPKRYNKNGNIDKNKSKGKLNISCREPLLIYSTIPPWRTQDVYKIKFYTTLIEKCTKSDDNATKLRICTSTLQSRGVFDMEAWTDASVENKQGTGAGNIYFLDKPNKIVTVTAPAGNLCSSYSAELVAIDITIEKLIQELDNMENIQNYKKIINSL